MKGNFDYEEMLKWDWADKHPFLYTFIESSPEMAIAYVAGKAVAAGIGAFIGNKLGSKKSYK